MELLVVFAVSALIIFGAQIIKIKVFTGDVDDAINFGSVKHTFCKALNEKLPHFAQPVRWLVFYMNVFLPALCIMSVYGVVTSLLNGFTISVASVVHLIFVVSCVLNCVFVRGIDDIAFWTNFAFMALWLADIVASVSGGILILTLVLLLPVVALNAVYFAKRRELFLLSAKQLAHQNEL